MTPGIPETAETHETPEATRIASVDGEPFVMGDGRVWYLAKPSLRMTPKVIQVPVHDEMPHGPTRASVQIENAWGYPPQIDQHVLAFDGSIFGPAKTENVDYHLVMEAAYHLLKRCHDVSDSTALAALNMTFGEADILAAGMLRMFRGLPPYGPADAVPSTPSEEPTEPSKV